MAHFRRFGLVSLLASLAVFSVWYLCVPLAQAQSGKNKSKAPKSASSAEVKQIDARLQKLQDNFEAESKAIIDGYERSGQYDRAKFLLEVLLKLDPKNEELKTRIADIDKQSMDKTAFDFKLDTSSDWTPVGTVTKDQSVRVEAIGEYKLNLTVTNLGPDGFASENILQDLVAKVPTGALMGMVVTAEHQDGKKPDPFAIKAKHEFTPKQDGTLFLKVNVPPGSRCNGDLRIKLGGIQRQTQ